MAVYEVANSLPNIPMLYRRSQALAVLDAILSPAWEDRYYSFDPHWSADEQLASMRNGSGDDYSIVFSPAGVFIRGFDHESVISPFCFDPPRLWPGLVNDIPEAFRHYLDEPAFILAGVFLATVCLWREIDDTKWRTGEIELPAETADPDGSHKLFDVLVDRGPMAYQQFALDYFGANIDPQSVAQIFDFKPMTADLVAQLNPGITIADIREELKNIRYPVQSADGV
jgi:hypothetical protein